MSQCRDTVLAIFLFQQFLGPVVELHFCILTQLTFPFLPRPPQLVVWDSTQQLSTTEGPLPHGRIRQ